MNHREWFSGKECLCVQNCVRITRVRKLTKFKSVWEHSNSISPRTTKDIEWKIFRIILLVSHENWDTLCFYGISSYEARKRIRNERYYDVSINNLLTRRQFILDLINILWKPRELIHGSERKRARTKLLFRRKSARVYMHYIPVQNE